jgi:hypothetical protein
VTGAEFSGVDIDLLADFIGGALAGTPEESVVAALVADDPAWRSAYESIGGGMALVGAELGRLAPEPMPVDLADRLDALFRSPAETFRPGTNSVDPEVAAPLVPVHGGGAVGDGAPVVPAKGFGGKRGRGRRLRWATPIAIAAGLVAFVGFGADYLAGRPVDDVATSSAGLADDKAAAPAGSAAMQIFASGTDYTAATLDTEPPRPLVAGGTKAVSPDASDPSAAPAPQAADSPSAGASATARKSDRAGPEQAATPGLQRLSGHSALLACLEAIERENAGGALAVESVDYARYGGAPAVVVRFSAANGRWAWASGPACGTPEAGAAKLGEVPLR